MKSAKSLVVVGLLLVAVVAVFALKQKKADDCSAVVAGESPPASAEAQPAAMPRLVDLGAGKCMACKMMTPVLEGLTREFAGRMEVEFIDVWENPGAGERFNVRVIPTQIFFSPAGEELFRHEGFLSREDILAKWKELNYEF